MAAINIPEIMIDERIDAGIEHEMERYWQAYSGPDPITDRIEYIRTMVVIETLNIWADRVERARIDEGLASGKRAAILAAATEEP